MLNLEARMKMVPLAATLLLVLNLAIQPLLASDFEREARLGEEMALNLFEGEVVTLNNGERDFLGAYIELDDPRGAVILLHGRGYHPDWQDVVGPLRTQLAEAGWSTLSLQMPVLEVGAKYYDYLPTFPDADRRIEAGIQFMRERVDGPLVLFGHSCGAHMAMHWFDSAGDASIDALITAGLGATDFGQDLVKPFDIERIQVPFLDALGSEEYERVMAMAPDRKQLIEAHGHPHSRQEFIDQADHYFKGRNRELGDAVADWLEGLPAK
jgi:hypothetical protein